MSLTENGKICMKNPNRDISHRTKRLCQDIAKLSYKQRQTRAMEQESEEDSMRMSVMNSLNSEHVNMSEMARFLVMGQQVKTLAAQNMPSHMPVMSGMNVESDGDSDDDVLDGAEEVPSPRALQHVLHGFL